MDSLWLAGLTSGIFIGWISLPILFLALRLLEEVWDGWRNEKNNEKEDRYDKS